MEMTDDGTWQVVELDDVTQVGAARRTAARLAEGAMLDEMRSGQLGIVVVELATNLVKHAQRGRLLLRIEGEGASAVVDVLAVDHGPGMDLERCFHDGFSTGGTSGTGLGAVRRAASLFDAYSDARGSVLFARLGDMPAPRRGSVAIPLKGELESGDRWRFLRTGTGWSALVVDGLGHGPGAAAAAAAVGAVQAEQPCAPARCLQVAHERARATRGAAASMVCFDRGTRSLLQAGVGNVAVSLVGVEEGRGLPSQNGTLGGICPAVREQRVDVPDRTLVVLHSDGLSARWSVHAYPGLRTRHPQVVAGTLFRDAHRARDDATVLVIETEGT
jgi:anti-sigma regulatory factor (Ser/Thr protein kinase)